MGIGVPELLLVLAIVIIVFGATRLPQLGDALGRSIRNFRKAASGEDEIDVTPRSERIEEPSRHRQVGPGDKDGSPREDGGERP